ncbi:hypothetical protein RFI_38415, partial [Reticulomyxa filosa]
FYFFFFKKNEKLFDFVMFIGCKLSTKDWKFFYFYFYFFIFIIRDWGSWGKGNGKLGKWKGKMERENWENIKGKLGKRKVKIGEKGKK